MQSLSPILDVVPLSHFLPLLKSRRINSRRVNIIEGEKKKKKKKKKKKQKKQKKQKEKEKCQFGVNILH